MITLPSPPAPSASASSDRGRSRTNIFNLLRLCLASAVIFSHSYPLLYGVHVFDPLERLTRAQKDLPGDHPIDAGHLAVYGFFVVSGYLVTMSWQNSRDVWSYLQKRVLRICPGYGVNVLLCAFLAAPLVAANRHTYLHDLLALKFWFLLNFCCSRGHDASPVSRLPFDAINGSLWTISYEFHCYLTVAVLGSLALLSRRLPWVSPKLRRAAPALLFAGTYALYCLHCRGHWLGTLGVMERDWSGPSSPHWARRLLFVLYLPGDPVVWSRQFAYFAAGMCLYLYRDRLLRRRWLVWTSALLVAVSAFVVPVLAYCLPLFGSYALLSLCLIASAPLSRIGSRNDLSYGLYLYAVPVQQILVYYAHPRAPGTLFAAALLITLVPAAGSWFLVERPCLRLKPKRRPMSLPTASAAAPTV